MRWVAWDAQLKQPDNAGTSARAHYEFAAKRGNPEAVQALTPPCDFPEELGYLWDDRFQVLHAMRGRDMNGPLPITVADLAQADRLFRWNLTEQEALALHRIDLAVRFPDAYMEQEQADATPVPRAAWPTRGDA